MSSVSPCFLKMPARWPTSDTEVSQLPRWPIVSLSVSCAAALVASNAAAIASSAILGVIVPSTQFFGCTVRRLFRCLHRGRHAAEITPVRRLGNNPFERRNRRMREVGLGLAERGALVAHGDRGIDHQLAEARHRDVAGAE